MEYEVVVENVGLSIESGFCAPSGDSGIVLPIAVSSFAGQPAIDLVTSKNAECSAGFEADRSFPSGSRGFDVPIKPVSSSKAEFPPLLRDCGRRETEQCYSDARYNS
jgi:hypothetical protein